MQAKHIAAIVTVTKHMQLTLIRLTSFYLFHLINHLNNLKLNLPIGFILDIRLNYV